MCHKLPEIERSTLETFISSLKIDRSTATGKVASLSLGQKAKVIFLILTQSDNELLVLDEVTRNISPLTIEVVNELLAQFNGAILAVSYDREFIERVIDARYDFTSEGLIEHK